MRNYWFKRRRYGWGWTPVTSKGWLTILGYLIVVIGSSELLLRDVPRNTYEPKVGVFFVCMVVSTAILVIIGHKKGPNPRWRWGQKSTDNPDEDI